MLTRNPIFCLAARLAFATAVLAVPTAVFSEEVLDSYISSQSFSSVQLPLTNSSSSSERITKGFVAASPAIIGPVEKIDLRANHLVVAGQVVDMQGLQIDQFEIGDYVHVDGDVSAQGISNVQLHKLDARYVYGASLTYVEGFISSATPLSATANIGALNIEFSLALSHSLPTANAVTKGIYVRAVGIQTSGNYLISADLSADGDAAKWGTPLIAKAIIGGDRSAKAIIGGDRSAKAIIGGDRSAKAIVGGDRSAKAIIGGDRSAKAIIGGDRSAKAIIGGDRSAKAIIGGDRSAKAIIGGDRSAKAIIGGDRSAKAIIGGDRSAKAIIGGDRSAKAIIGGDRSAKAIIGGDRSAKAIIGGDRSAKAIIGGDRSAKAIIGGDRSAKAIIGGDRSAKVIIGGDRSAQ